jgi:hypothetical protein
LRGKFYHDESQQSEAAKAIYLFEKSESGDSLGLVVRAAARR